MTDSIRKRNQQTDAQAVSLPLRDVILFSSGVGYFQRTGKIKGTAATALPFRTEQINDILKSLVLFDPTGNVQPVTYTTKDSLSRRLRSAGLSLDNDDTLGGVLSQFQGARLRLEMGGEGSEGRLISVSTKSVPVPGAKEGAVKTEIINLLTESGLRSVSLEQVTQIKLLDEHLDQELRESLELLATGLGDQQRQVQLHFGGDASREVRVGYLQETPVWKTSYRLVVEKKQKSYLQGWAIVENTTEEDWKNVRLSLVAGRPVSFIQDLYQPLYATRPVVASQVAGSPTPQLYGEAVAEAGAVMDFMTEELPLMARYDADPGERGIASYKAPARAARQATKVSAEKLTQSVVPQTQGAERGDLFEYAIREPVTLPRQQAALVPIVSEQIEGERLSIYDAREVAAHPFNGFRLKNSSTLHLAGGPITVFQDGTYAGDAQITDLQPGEDRLISFAVDLDVVVDYETPIIPRETVAVTAEGGVLKVTHKSQNEFIYTFRNKSDSAKTVLVQQPIEGDFELVEPATPAEKTAEEYRFKVEVAPQQNVCLKVLTERPISETIALVDADLKVLARYAKSRLVSAKLKTALEQVVAKRRLSFQQMSDLTVRITKLKDEITAINDEQNRIRQNMERLDHNSDLYKRYVAKLTGQETQIEKLREELALAQDKAQNFQAQAQQELQEFIRGLDMK